MSVSFCAAATLALTTILSAQYTAAQSNAPLPDRKMAISLIYETIITINNASHTNNYSVLRALGAPEFQKKYRTKDLEKTFGELAKRGLNLRPSILVTPQIRKSIFSPARNLLRLQGHLPTKPIQVNFDIQYKIGRPKTGAYMP